VHELERDLAILSAEANLADELVASAPELLGEAKQRRPARQAALIVLLHHRLELAEGGRAPGR
jgi:hypothetical protein